MLEDIIKKIPGLKVGLASLVLTGLCGQEASAAPKFIFGNKQQKKFLNELQDRVTVLEKELQEKDQVIKNQAVESQKRLAEVQKANNNLIAQLMKENKDLKAQTNKTDQSEHIKQLESQLAQKQQELDRLNQQVNQQTTLSNEQQNNQTLLVPPPPPPPPPPTPPAPASNKQTSSAATSLKISGKPENTNSNQTDFTDLIKNGQYQLKKVETNKEENENINKDQPISHIDLIKQGNFKLKKVLKDPKVIEGLSDEELWEIILGKVQGKSVDINAIPVDRLVELYERFPEMPIKLITTKAFVKLYKNNRPEDENEPTRLHDHNLIEVASTQTLMEVFNQGSLSLENLTMKEQELLSKRPDYSKIKPAIQKNKNAVSSNDLQEALGAVAEAMKHSESDDETPSDSSDTTW